MFKDKVCVITGEANGIGKAINDEFLKQNAKCYVIDICEGDHYIGDISNKETLETFVKYVIDPDVTVSKASGSTELVPGDIIKYVEKEYN